MSACFSPGTASLRYTTVQTMRRKMTLTGEPTCTVLLHPLLYVYVTSTCMYVCVCYQCLYMYVYIVPALVLYQPPVIHPVINLQQCPLLRLCKSWEGGRRGRGGSFHIREDKWGSREASFRERGMESEGEMRCPGSIASHT